MFVTKLGIHTEFERSIKWGWWGMGGVDPWDETDVTLF